MIPLETIRIASPCSADWDAMEGTDQARFCQSCRKNVYNLSAMTRAEAEALVTRTEGKVCVRFYTRADGTVLTQDCPVGLRAVRRRLVRKLSYAAALLLSGASGLLRGPAQAVTVAKKPAMQKPAAKPHAAKPTQYLMGKPIAPGHTLGRPARPPQIPTVTAGMITLPPAVMGAPPVPPKR